ncbi:MAG: hypothetical protein NTZ80_03730, partial [Patescibacteria group bacterium]|nr:hypothetical protein [Patescibacteria group bacterium]
FNKPVSKEKFEEEKSKLGYDNYASKLKKKFLELIKTKAIHRGFPGFDNENVSGDHIFHSQNIGNGFLIFDSRELTYAFEVSKQQDSYDIEGCSQGELIYESFGNDFAYRSIGCITCEYLNDSYYCDYCFNSQNLFASIGLRHKQYCILNKQYSKQEYEELVPKIIEHMQKTPLHQDYAGQAGEWPASRSFSEGWGEFFDPRVSPFGYNETVAQEYFPLTKKQAQEQGFNWSDYEAPFPKVEKIIKADELDRDQKFLIPENNDILNYAIECEITHKPFRIIKQELDFYRKHNLPLPKRHPDQRHKDRLSLRNPRKLWNRTCNKCNIPIQTSYSPDRPETVYCERCYLEAVY